ncbi:inner membrane protein [alpha proteobacterium U9-1i]|nr:inner membrane protein [alpha proteobacterium U9-1i]
MDAALAILSLIGTAVFAASGALVADEDRLDLVGALFLAVATAIGGGTIVDLLIGHTPVRWIETPTTLWLAAAAGTATFLLTRVLRGGKHASITHAALLWADAAGLAVFTATGMERLSALDIDPVVCVFLAAIGASGGGILRDVLANRTPIVFSPETELYVTAAFAGGAAYYAAEAFTNAPQAPLIVALVVTGAVRAAGILFHIKLGTMRRATDA